jgi:hypothetical protein
MVRLSGSCKEFPSNFSVLALAALSLPGRIQLPRSGRTLIGRRTRAISSPFEIETQAQFPVLDTNPAKVPECRLLDSHRHYTL